MGRLLVTIAFLGIAATASGCASMGISNPFDGPAPSAVTNNGEIAGQSTLLGIALPSGLRRFPAHGYQSANALGDPEGLEILRGNMAPSALLHELHGSLTGHGWQLRTSWRKADRWQCVYEHQSRIAVLRVSTQAVLSILEIWVGNKLPDGSMLTFPTPSPTSPHSSGQNSGWGNDSYGGFEPEGSPSWGNSTSGGTSSGGLEERPL